MQSLLDSPYHLEDAWEQQNQMESLNDSKQVCRNSSFKSRVLILLLHIHEDLIDVITIMLMARPVWKAR